MMESLKGSVRMLKLVKSRICFIMYIYSIRAHCEKGESEVFSLTVYVTSSK